LKYVPDCLRTGCVESPRVSCPPLEIHLPADAAQEALIRERALGVAQPIVVGELSWAAIHNADRESGRHLAMREDGMGEGDEGWKGWIKMGKNE